jgi:hypothetical protein
MECGMSTPARRWVILPQAPTVLPRSGWSERVSVGVSVSWGKTRAWRSVTLRNHLPQTIIVSQILIHEAHTIW